ncbi:MAG: ribonuclease Z [Lachnospiraceae bacterium]|nr:ribonuclease Z [Lachnospiraceae bacterium]
MFEVCLLGTGGMMPLPYRWLTSLIVRYNGSNVLIDCGEGTQVALRDKGWSPKPIDVILFTHYHADHISGLPGMFLTIGNSDRVEPITLIGPKGLKKVVESLLVIAPQLPFELKYIEIEGDFQRIDYKDLHIDAFKVNHNVTCYGYSISIDRAGRFDAQKAKSLNIPLKCWSRLQKGEVIETDGVTYTPDMVMGPARKGIKVTYTTDTRPCRNIPVFAKESDLFICEGMYGENEMIDKAKEHKHMTFSEAAKMAKEAEVKELWLTHYSPSLFKPKEFIDNARSVFENSIAAKDGMSVDLRFEED